MPLPYPPFRIKVVEPIAVTTPREREEVLAHAGFNPFRVPADRVSIDLLTDSGTGAMSAAQWARTFEGDESYAGSPSFRRFERTVRAITGMEHVLPAHQGRAAERLVFEALVRPGDVVPSNTAYDTTRANVERRGARVVDLPHASASSRTSNDPFKGDIDLAALEEVLRQNPGRVPLVVFTLTHVASGGQPAQPANLEAARALCQRNGVPLWLDAARFAENAALTLQRDPASFGKTPRRVAGEFFACADGAFMSCKKDGLANVGGFVALRERELAARLGEILLRSEGFLTYGGLAGRDLEAIAVGLDEALDPEYLAHRLGQVRLLHDALCAAGVPVLRPAGGHAVFVDAGAMLPHLPPDTLPGHALACELYLQAGIRACEVGTLMFGPGKQRPHDLELLRLAIPRRTYETAHLEFAASAVAAVAARPEDVPGYEIVEGDGPLRHFTARLRPVIPPASGLAVAAVP